MSTILEAASKKLNRQVSRLFYKNGIEITAIADLRENDEMYIVNAREMDAMATAPVAGSPNPQPSITPPDSPSMSGKKAGRKFERRPKAYSTASPGDSLASPSTLKKRPSRGELITKKSSETAAKKNPPESPANTKKSKRGSSTRVRIF